MKIGIYGQFYHKNSETYIQLILDVLKNKNVSVFIEENFLDIINLNNEITRNFSNFETFTELDESYDLFLVSGVMEPF